MGIIDIFNSGLNIEMVLTILFAYIIAIVIGITVHEWAHAFVAYKCGDDTAKLSGRMTLNPGSHFDGFGFVCLLLLGFGWAKPVPVNPLRFRNVKKGSLLVGFAGITVNIIIAIVSTFLYVLFINILDTSMYISAFVVLLCQYLAVINFMLALFNLLPIYPLDGFNIVNTLLRPGNKFAQFMYKYSLIFMLAFLIVGGYWLSKLVYLIFESLGSLFMLLF